MDVDLQFCFDEPQVIENDEENQKFELENLENDQNETIEVEDDERKEEIIEPSYVRKKGSSVTMNDFNVLYLLGKGAFGRVFCVEAKFENNQKYALKIISKSRLKKKKRSDEYVRSERDILVNLPSYRLLDNYLVII